MLKKYRTRKLAKQIYLALLTNPERYRYMTACYESGKYSHEELNEKNVNKAYKLAESFLNFKGASKRSSNVVENEQSKEDSFYIEGYEDDICPKCGLLCCKDESHKESD